MIDRINKFANLGWTSIAAIGIFVGFLYYVVSFDDGEKVRLNIASASRKIGEARKRLEEVKAELSNTEEFKKKVEAVEEEFKQLTEALPKEVSSTDILSIVSRQAAETGVAIKESVPSGGNVKEEFYEKAKVKVELEGGFASVVSFMSRLTGVKRLITFEKVELKRMPGADPLRSQVQFRGMIVGYRYIPESERPKDTKPKQSAAPGP